MPTSRAASRPAVSGRRTRAIYARLQKQHGPFTPKRRLPIIDELVMTVLSQHTSDANSGRAFANLKARFPTWDDVLEAPAEEVADAIRTGGLADTKSIRIQQILAEIGDREGSIDLTRLNSLPDHEVTDYLVSLPGVGPKTAACVLLFSMGRDAFPVDTHVHRVALRLGLIPPKTNADRAHRLLTDLTAREIRYELHVQLVRHGRTVCKPARPRCSDCVLFDLCSSGQSLLARGLAT